MLKPKARPQRKPEPEPALMQYIQKLNASEQALICVALNAFGNNRNAHRGVLPFFRLREVISCLEAAKGGLTPEGMGRRAYATILSKIEAHKWRPPPRKVTLTLHNQKVAGKLGAHPERGVLLRWLPKKRVTVGVKTILDKTTPDVDVLVNRCIALKCLRRLTDKYGRWELTAEPEHLHRVEAWLLEHCA